MKKIVLIMLLTLISTISSAKLIKINNNVICSSIPQKEHIKDKFLSNLPKNTLISCGLFVYNVDKKSWYYNDLNTKGQ